MSATAFFSCPSLTFPPSYMVVLIATSNGVLPSVLTMYIMCGPFIATLSTSSTVFSTSATSLCSTVFPSISCPSSSFYSNKYLFMLTDASMSTLLLCFPSVVCGLIKIGDCC